MYRHGIIAHTTMAYKTLMEVRKYMSCKQARVEIGSDEIGSEGSSQHTDDGEQVIASGCDAHRNNGGDDCREHHHSRGDGAKLPARPPRGLVGALRPHEEMKRPTQYHDADERASC